MDLRTCINEAVTTDEPGVVSLFVPGMKLENEAASGRVDGPLLEPRSRLGGDGGLVAAEFEGWTPRGAQLRTLEIEKQTDVVRTTEHASRAANDTSSKRVNLPFLQILPTAAIPFLLQDRLHGFPRLLLLLLSISVLLFSFFSVLHFLVVVSVR